MYSGGTAILTAAASGTPAPTFSWARSNDNGSTWTTLGGATAATYSLTVQPADNGAQFRATAVNAGGSATSAAAILTEVPAVYAGGNNPTAGFWLNGTWTDLPVPAGGTPFATSLAVANGHVYVGGSYWSSTSVQSPGYWLDGTWTALPVPAGAAGGVVNALVLAGGEVYAAGSCTVSNGTTPGLWQNGNWTALPQPTGLNYGTVTSLAVGGGTVYAGGWCGPSIQTLLPTNGGQPGYWLNGAWVGLPNGGGLDGIVTSLALPASQLYAAGSYVNDQGIQLPGYWLDGSFVALATPANARLGGVTAITVAGSEVYASGSYWIPTAVNGSTTTLTAVPGSWHNGAWTGVTVPAAYTGAVLSAVTVSGNEVYLGGYCTGGTTVNGGSVDYPGYFLNGTWINLPLMKSGSGSVTNLVVIP